MFIFWHIFHKIHVWTELLYREGGQHILIGNAHTMQVLQTACQKRSHIIYLWCSEQFWWTSKVNQRWWVSLSVHNPVCFYLNSTSHNYRRQLIHCCCAGLLPLTQFQFPAWLPMLKRYLECEIVHLQWTLAIHNQSHQIWAYKRNVWRFLKYEEV